jgi:hypothetical protein
MRLESVGGAGTVPLKGVMPGKVCHKLFKKMDRNHDGVVSRDEARQSGVFKFLDIAKTADEEKKVFDKIDSNHDGGMSEGESTAFFSELFARSKKAFALATLFVADVPDDDEDKARKSAKDKAAKAKPRRATGTEADRQRHAAKAQALSPGNIAELAKYALDKSVEQAGAQIDKTREVLEARLTAREANIQQKSDEALATAAKRTAASET